MSTSRDRDEILYDKVQEDSEIDRLESHIERLYKENAGLKEYSESRDESIKVYREEIKELNEVTNYYVSELHKAEERLRGIEEVYKFYNLQHTILDEVKPDEMIGRLWQAIKSCVEVKP